VAVSAFASSESAAQPGEHQSGWFYLAVLGGLAAFAFIVWLLWRLFPSTRQYGANVGNALMRAEGQFLPGREHIVQAIER
jgi:hypothetical protein